MFGFGKKTTKPQTSYEQIQKNLAKSRELNEQLYALSGGFMAQTNQMLNATRKEVKRV